MLHLLALSAPGTMVARMRGAWSTGCATARASWRTHHSPKRNALFRADAPSMIVMSREVPAAEYAFRIHAPTPMGQRTPARRFEAMASYREAGDETRVPWPVAVSFPIDPLGNSFTLPDVYALADPLRSALPNNRHVEAKIRQSLQILRDRGQLAFAGGGRYEKLLPVPAKSVRLDFGSAAHFSSRSQIACVAVESWAARNVACRRCESSLVLAPSNAKLLDAVCRANHHEIQVKGVAGIATDRLTAAAFGPMSERLATGRLPDYLIVSYDRTREIVTMAEFIDGTAIDASRVIARTALPATARRAGWIGSTIDLSGLTREVVVGPSFAPEIERWGL